MEHAAAGGFGDRGAPDEAEKPHEMQDTKRGSCASNILTHGGDAAEKFIESLHKKYGAFVQMAPKQIWVNSADGLRDVFSVTKRLDRPGPVPLLHLYHTENLVSTESGQLHHECRKLSRSIYTVQAMETCRYLNEHVDSSDIQYICHGVVA